MHLTNVQLWNRTHEIMGTVIVCLFSIQPLLGLYHHRLFIRTGSRNWCNLLHVWLGRALILLGIINGGIGLQLGRNTTAGQRGIYIGFTGVVAVAYGLALIVYYWRMRK